MTLLIVVLGAFVVTAAGMTSELVHSRPLVPLTAAQLAKCRGSTLLRPACVSEVPRVNGRYRAFRARDGRVVPELWVFDLEYFVPSRPPKGAHITIAAGAVRRLTPYREPDAESRVVRLGEEIRKTPRTRPVSFGFRRWNGVKGILYLAPPYLHGGQLGDHLVFQWGEGSAMHAVSLHSWAPLEETAATLRAMVETIP